MRARISHACARPARRGADAEPMPQFSTTRRVQHSATDMFVLVADVERYPEFVPLCRELRVRRRVVQAEGVEVLTADMTVAYKMIHVTFTSKVTLDKPRLRILVEYLSGPFRQMENQWIFRNGPLRYSTRKIGRAHV